MTHEDPKAVETQPAASAELSESELEQIAGGGASLAQDAGQPAAQKVCRNNLKQLGLGIN